MISLHNHTGRSKGWRRSNNYFTIPAAFSNTTCDSTAVSVFAGKCEQKPIPT